ncbi:unnamed protein product [Brassica oleracea var. botrytis]
MWMDWCFGIFFPLPVNMTSSWICGWSGVLGLLYFILVLINFSI